MSTVENSSLGAVTIPAANAECNLPLVSLHRIATVRQQQGVSVRTAARRLGVDVRTVRSQEEETADLKLSSLYQWQQALEVPVADLLVDSGAPLSRPVMERARMVRLMKTALSVLQQSESPAVQRMAQTMVDQLLEMMPELSEVTAWHVVGQRRTLDELGRIAERPMPDFDG